MAYSKRTASTALLTVVVFASIVMVPSAAAADSTHLVEPGDTLSVIAGTYGVSTADLAAANGITNLHFIRVGQQLTVPTLEPSIHTVAAGDSVSVIARTYGVSSKEIVALNGLANANRIRIGQELLLPGEAVSDEQRLAALAARYPSLPKRIVETPERLALIPSFERWAAHYGVPRDLLMAVAYQESGWQKSIESHKGAIGVGQLLPGTAAWIAEDLIGILGLDPHVADDNIRMSARFLLWLIGYLGDEQLALGGYFQGPTSVTLRGFYDQTHLYVASVEGARWRFQRS